MLEIKNLTYKYENHIALNNINLKIEKGEKIAILGNNGSGKTTFFLCRSEEHTSELQSLRRISYAVFCLKKRKNQNETEI